METFYVVGVLDAKQSEGIGWWKDGDTLYEDPIRVYEDIEEALKAGKENRQECILEVTVDPNGEGYLNYAENLCDDVKIGDAFNSGLTTGFTRLYSPLEVDGRQIGTFTVTDVPLGGVPSVRCSYRFLYTNGAEGRFTYYLNLLIAKTQKAGTIFRDDGVKPFTVKVGRFAFAPDNTGYEIPAVRCHYGNGDDDLFAFNEAFTANGKRWYCFRGLPQSLPDELGSTFKKSGRSKEHLLRKVLTYWAKLGGSSFIGEEPSPYAVVAVKLSEGWLNLLP